ncbi:hypothetical protein HCN44_005249 [Aphidius gifuensis]|uniref:lysozyme n=1 Tax=Aphidius gifuensis TaxID=684658 RepID=A0A834Y3E4_APHGI|nr:invertebrate-type lysozyme 3-like [Aphidius gifuensis]KAF7996972.1 hypothetical protein HCN44_005249 [Aphidius gifuensis]
MTMKIVIVVTLLAACTYGQQVSSQNSTAEPISQICFGCICEAASGCDTQTGCDGAVCGPFRITWGYWADADKITLNGEDPKTEGAYSRCLNDAFCASKVVESYMNKFGQDCNGDGRINCDDYVRIHRLGGYGCSSPLDSKYENTYKTCMKTFSH